MFDFLAISGEKKDPKLEQIIKDIRIRKGLKVGAPSCSFFLLLISVLETSPTSRLSTITTTNCDLSYCGGLWGDDGFVDHVNARERSRIVVVVFVSRVIGRHEYNVYFVVVHTDDCTFYHMGATYHFDTMTVFFSDPAVISLTQADPQALRKSVYLTSEIFMERYKQ